MRNDDGTVDCVNIICLGHWIFIPQIKEASEIWWFGGLSPELFTRVYFMFITYLHSHF